MGGNFKVRSTASAVNENDYSELSDEYLQHFYTILENTGGIISSRSLSGELVYFNENFKKSVNKILKVDVKKGDKVFFPVPDNVISWEDALSEVATGCTFSTEFDLEAGGIVLSFQLTVCPIVQNGNIIGSAEIIKDITYQKHSVKGLDLPEKRIVESVTRDNKIQFDAVLTDVPFSEGIAVTEPDGTILYVNPAFEKISGYTNNEISGHNPRILKSGEQKSSFYKVMWKTVLKGDLWTGRIINRKKNGELFTSETSISPVKDENGDIVNFIWIIRDISTELALEEKLFQAQKMEAIGCLAGGIAHDFNNILSPVIIQTELAMMDLDPESPIQLNLTEIHNAGKRAKELVRQILTFARRNDREIVPLKASVIIKETIKFLRSTIPSTIDIRFVHNAKLDTVFADPIQMNQIIMNLCTNSAHAMQEKGGILKVILENETVTGAQLEKTLHVKPGKYLKISVVDEGTGIPCEIIEKIFEPYFTTKKKGEGTGLGLSVIHGIVKEYEGDILVESEAGKGTAFHLFLPVFERDLVSIARENSSVKGGNESILLIDDEKPAVQAIGKILGRLGYDVTASTNSIEALGAYKSDPEAFDLIITDQTMPGMTGKELAKEVIGMDGNTPIIICTGFSDQLNEEEALRMGISAFILKPIIMSELSEIVRTVLDDRRKG